jgi:hypothetical protein
MIQRIHCRACSFWKAGTLSQQRYGTCQRYAPRPVAAGDDFEWARTLEDDWCGEAQPARISNHVEEGPDLDEREDAKQVIEYIKAYPALFVNEGAQRVVLDMLKVRFQL